MSWLVLALMIHAFVPAAIADDAGRAGKRALDAIERHCVRCHGRVSPASGGLDYILDVPRMIRNGLIVPGEPFRSELFKRMVDGTMPRGSRGDYGESDVAAVREWIAKGAAPLPATPESIARTAPRPVPEREWVAAIEEDLRDAGASERKDYRYLELASWANLGLSDRRRKQGVQAVNKRINSLSWSKKLVRAEQLGPQGVLLRLNLRALGWRNSSFQALAARAPKYAASTEQALEALRSVVPESGKIVVPGEWFLSEASRAPHYYDFLELPATLAELESRLGVDSTRNTRAGKVIRAGLQISFASKFNRVVERQALPGGGAYWKTFNFDGRTGARSILERPLGPPSYGFPEARSFLSAGSEAIFDLPNGMHGYFVADEAGRRKDRIAPEVAIDPEKNRGFVVVVSCFSCHGAGMNSGFDVIASGAHGAHTAVQALYPGQKKFDEAILSDNVLFEKALRKLGIDPRDPEPISTVAGWIGSPGNP